jgi:hypothetical protein
VASGVRQPLAPSGVGRLFRRLSILASRSLLDDSGHGRVVVAAAGDVGPGHGRLRPSLATAADTAATAATAAADVTTAFRGGGGPPLSEWFGDGA